MPQLLMYVRTGSCPDQSAALRYLAEFKIKPVEVNISREADAAQMLMDLAGCLAIPTFVAADGDNQPIEPPRPMEPRRSVRNVDRGSIISEPTRDGLRAFLIRHGFLAT